MSQVIASGRCLCGAVSYSVAGEPVRMAQCHCRDCQRASGTGHMSHAFFKADQVTLTGQTKGFAVTSDGGNTVTRHFCPECGGGLLVENTSRPGLVGIAVGSCEDTSWYRPQVVVYTSRRASWDATPTDIPNFERMQPGTTNRG